MKYLLHRFHAGLQSRKAVREGDMPDLDFAAKKIGAAPKRFKDYRQLLDLKDLDIFMIVGGFPNRLFR